MAKGHANEGSKPKPAPDPVECPASPSGKHQPRTVEGVENGVHVKRSVCRHCSNIA